MQVFPDGIHRSLFRFLEEPGHERFLRLLLLPLGTKGQGRTVLSLFLGQGGLNSGR